MPGKGVIFPKQSVPQLAVNIDNRTVKLNLQITLYQSNTFGFCYRKWSAVPANSARPT